MRKQKDVAVSSLALIDWHIEAVTSDDAGLPSSNWNRLSKGRFDKVPTGMSGVDRLTENNSIIQQKDRK